MRSSFVLLFRLGVRGQLGIERVKEQRAVCYGGRIIRADATEPLTQQINPRSSRFQYEVLHRIYLINDAGNTGKDRIILIKRTKKSVKRAMSAMVR
jgi:hypothetical protein